RAAVRPFEEGDLRLAAQLGERLREDGVDPFGAQLEPLWRSGRARRELWRVAAAGGALCGLSLAAERCPGRLDFFGAVAPAQRRRGLGTRLLQPALEAAGRDRLALHAGAREASAGCAFLTRHGFSPAGRTLLLERRGPLAAAPIPVRALDAK